MKNKYIVKLYALITICIAGVSCEDTRLTGMVDDKLYILNGGSQVVNLLRTEAKNYDLVIYKAGISDKSAKARIKIDLDFLEEFNSMSEKKYQLLPEACYKLSSEETVVFKDEASEIIPIIIDGGAVFLLQGRLTTNYALPISIEAVDGSQVEPTKSTVLIIPRIN